MESAVLAVLGAAMGLLLSVVMVRGLLRFLPANGMLATLRAEPDWRILAFNAALAIGTALLFGLAPAWQALKVDLWSTLKEGAGSVGGNRGSVSLRKSLVTAQVAFSFLLVSGALLFGKTLLNLKETNSGFRDIDNLITFQIDPARSGYSLPRLKAFYQQVLENVAVVARGEVGRLCVGAAPERPRSGLGRFGRGPSGRRSRYPGLCQRPLTRLLANHGGAAAGGPRLRGRRCRRPPQGGHREPQIRQSFFRRPESHRTAHRIGHRLAEQSPTSRSWAWSKTRCTRVRGKGCAARFSFRSRR